MDQHDETPEETPDETPEAPAPESAAKGIGATGWVAFAIAVLFGISGGLAWWATSRSDDLAVGQERDAVLVAAKTEIATLNSLDYRSVSQGLKAWQAASTGTLRDQFAGISTKDQQVLADQKKISTGKVVEAAVLDVDDDSASVLAAVEVTVRDGADKTADPVVKRNRFSADLTRSGGQWKVSNLQQVAVNVS